MATRNIPQIIYQIEGRHDKKLSHPDFEVKVLSSAELKSLVENLGEKYLAHYESLTTDEAKNSFAKNAIMLRGGVFVEGSRNLKSLGKLIEGMKNDVLIVESGDSFMISKTGKRFWMDRLNASVDGGQSKDLATTTNVDVITRSVLDRTLARQQSSVIQGSGSGAAAVIIIIIIIILLLIFGYWAMARHHRY